MGKRILVVDDDMVCLKTIQRYLEEEHYEVIGALSGMQAVHIVTEIKIDLLLLDIEMPGVNGFATLELIRKSPEGKQLPVIFFTGRTDMDTVKRCATMGTAGYITKPVERHVLLERVREICAGLSLDSEEKTILIVDSDIDFLKKVKLYLKAYYKVAVIPSAESAIDYLKTRSTDLLIWCDSVPLKDVSEAEALVGKSKQEFPVLVLTEGKKDRQGKGMTGSFKYISKPIEPSQLLNCIEDCFSEWMAAASKAPEG